MRSERYLWLSRDKDGQQNERNGWSRRPAETAGEFVGPYDTLILFDMNSAALRALIGRDLQPGECVRVRLGDVEMVTLPAVKPHIVLSEDDIARTTKDDA